MPVAVQVAASSPRLFDGNAKAFLDRCQKKKDPTAQVMAKFQAARGWVTPCFLAGPVSSDQTREKYDR